MSILNIPPWTIKQPEELFTLTTDKKETTDSSIFRATFQELSSQYPHFQHIYVRRKVRIDTIPELPCAKWEFSLCPTIPELYRTILELRKGYMLKIDKICVPA